MSEWYVFFYPYTFMFSVSLYLKWISCKKSIVVVFFKPNLTIFVRVCVCVKSWEVLVGLQIYLYFLEQLAFGWLPN